MVADALTKGSPDRERIENALSGSIKFEHDQKIWRPRAPVSQT